MPPTPTLDDEPKFSTRVKQHFQPSEPAREVKAPEPKAPESKEPEKKEPEKQPAKEPEKAPEKKEPVQPASEDEAVFGTPVVKPTEPKKPDGLNDETFEKTLAEETKGMTEKAQAKWIQLRRSEKAAKDDAATVRAELKAAAEARQEAKVTDDTPKVEALTQENANLKLQLAEMEKDIAVTKVERSPKYRREVSEPLAELTKQAEDMAARYEVSPKTLLAALSEDPKTRPDTLAELAADFKEGDRIDLYSIAKEMDRLSKKSEALREKAKNELSTLEQQEREEDERTAAEVRQTLTASAARAWEEAAQTLAFLNHNPKAPEWSAALATAKSKAESHVFGQDAIADGRISSQAAQLPFVLKAREHDQKVIKTLTEERDTLLARIESDNAHDPDLGGHGDEGDVSHGEEGNEGLTLGQMAKAKFGK